MMNEACKRYDEKMLWEQCEEAVFRLAMFKYEQREAECAADLLRNGTSELSDKDIADAYSRSLNSFYSTLDRGVMKSRHKRVRQALPRAARVFAYTLLICYLMGTVAVAASDTVRVYLARFLIQVKSEYTQLSLQTSQSDYIDVPVEWKGSYFPAYVPEGFSLINVSGDEILQELRYETSDGRMLFINENSIGVEMNIDTEDAQIDYVDINGSRALVAVKEEVSRVAWSMGTRYFAIEYDGPADEAVRVAKGIEMIK